MLIREIAFISSQAPQKISMDRACTQEQLEEYVCRIYKEGTKGNISRMENIEFIRL